MTKGNAETLRVMIEDFDAGGVDASLEHIHPEVTWNAPPEWLERRVYVGHQGIRELAASWEENFEEYRLEIERLEELDEDRAFVLVRQRGTIRGSVDEIEQAVAFIAEIRDGLVVRVDVFFSWEAGLEAAGLEQ
jgi:ketosteroid isomerase-like protein